MEPSTFWGESPLVRRLSRHSLGRDFLSAVGSRYVRRTVEGFPIVLDLRDRWGVSKFILRHGAYDPGLCRAVERFVKPGATCLDVGANIGFWTCFLGRKLQAARVIAFEPEPHNQELFRQNVAENGLGARVELVEGAVGEAPAELELFLSEDNAGDHQLYRTQEARKSVRVPVRRVDDVVPDLLPAETRVDFIKMDIQGYEPYALKGMRRTLENNADVLVLTEFWPAGIERAGASPEETLAFLEGMGFKIYVVNDLTGEMLPIERDKVVAHAPPGHHLDLLLSRTALL